MERTRAILEAINLVNIELGYQAFYGVILGSDQGRDLYKKKLTALTEQYKMNNQIKFIDHCKDMALAYKVSILCFSLYEPELSAEYRGAQQCKK